MNGVLVLLEYRGAWNRMSWEALAAGRDIAVQLNQPLMAAVAGSDLDGAAADLAGRPLTRAYTVRHPLLAEYTSDGFTAAFEQLIQSLTPSLVLFPHTYQVRDFAPRLATRFGQSLIADVVAIEPSRDREGAVSNWSFEPVLVRQLLQGKLTAEYVHTGVGPCFASLQAGAFRADTLTPGTCTVEEFVPRLEALQIRSQPGQRFRESAQTVDLSAASLIVSVGRGIKEQGNIAIVQELADTLGAELAASRPICDSGWLPMERQVGSSGQTVSPKVYIAVGISGAIQHLVGMKGSKAVIAINKDENAPIFEVADYGIVGDLFEIVPALTDAVRRAKSM
jgi:electron transfer flavoprotein alpha subunit